MIDHKRVDGRLPDEVRNISVLYDVYGYADASVLYTQGKTVVLVAVTLTQGVPLFLKGQRRGWLSAEYAMLPTATHQRVARDATLSTQKNYRNIEISRLIGRSLRSALDLNHLGERTIQIDCDVLQADGGTRVACITAASLALDVAVKRWLERKLIDKPIINHKLVALSAGIVRNTVCVDLCYEEDAIADADFNLITTTTGAIVEIQGTAEKGPIEQALFDQIKSSGLHAIALLVKNLGISNSVSSDNFTIQKLLKNQQNELPGNKQEDSTCLGPQKNKNFKQEKSNFFTLSARLTNKSTE